MLPELFFIDTPASDVCIFWFDGPAPYVTSVAAIHRGHCCLVLDTYCGSYYMDFVREELQKRFAPKHFCLLNTHHHWDHIWGDVSFADCPIYSTPLCQWLISHHWEAQLEENSACFKGKQEMILPNILVDEPLEILPQLYAFPSPGHTVDSLSVWDEKNQFLFAGDTVESPVVQLNHRNLREYRQTLQRFLALKPKAVFSGHSRNSSPFILTETSNYLNALVENMPLTFQDETAQQTHLDNLRLLAVK